MDFLSTKSHEDLLAVKFQEIEMKLQSISNFCQKMWLWVKETEQMQFCLHVVSC